MKTAAAYIRVSTEEQTELSPDSQLKEIRKYAKAHSIIVPDEFVFIDAGISGRNTAKRTAFNKMIGTAKKNPRPFDAILLWKFSRFARNREDSIVYKSMLRKQCGIDVISISESLGDDKMSILIEAMIEAMDEYYSINLAEEVKRGMTEKAERGEVVSNPPFGYNIKDNVFVPDEKTADIVRLIFNEFDSGTPYLRIAKMLNAKGIKTKRGSNFENRTVEYILRNPVYTGKLVWNPDKSSGKLPGSAIVREGRHEPIITQEQFDRVQKRAENFKKRCKYTRGSPGSYALKGLVRCSSCGSTLSRQNKNYMQCVNYAHGKCSESHSVVMQKLEKAVVRQMRHDIKKQTFKLTPSGPVEKSPVSETEYLIKKERAKLKRVKEAYAEGIDTLEEYKSNKTKILTRIKELELMQKPGQLNDNEARKIFNKKLRTAIDTMLDINASPETKNESLKAVIYKIVLQKPENKIRIYYYG